MFKKLHIVPEQFDKLTPEARIKYRDFYFDILKETYSAHMVDNIPLMTIGDAMNFLCHFSTSKWLIEFSQTIENEPIDLLWHAVSQILENNKNL